MVVRSLSLQFLSRRSREKGISKFAQRLSYNLPVECNNENSSANNFLNAFKQMQDNFALLKEAEVSAKGLNAFNRINHIDSSPEWNFFWMLLDV